MSGDPLRVGELDGPARKALQRLILTLADSKRLMGIRYSDWLLGAPSIETGIAASSMAQDEWGHARLLYAMLKELGVDPGPVEHERPAEEYASVDVLDRPFENWAAVVAAMVVVDGALTVALEGFSGGALESARSRVPKMLSEEEFHASLGEAWYKRLAAGSDEARALLADATRSMLPPVLAWLGAGDEGARLLADAGVTDDGATLLERYHTRIEGVVAEVGVKASELEPATEWDPGRARGPGHPDEEAVERARGDRNRALFVE